MLLLGGNAAQEGGGRKEGEMKVREGLIITGSMKGKEEEEEGKEGGMCGTVRWERKA